MKQRSDSSCRQGYSWGYDRRGIWVDHGCRADFQVSSYDLYAPPWAFPPDREFRGLDEFPFVAGEFVWTGFDYLGEPTPYNADSTSLLNFTDPKERNLFAAQLKEPGKISVPSRSSYFGIIDLAGFKKDRFYLYQARWRPTQRMAHILPHWTWPERVGKLTPIHVYTSGDEAELFLNNASLGRKKRGPLDYRIRWDNVNYQPGILRVVAYKNGNKWTESSVRTAGEHHRQPEEADLTVLQLQQAGECLTPVHLGHDDVGQEQRKGLFLEPLIGVEPIAKRDDIVAGLGERLDQKAPHVLIVFGEQNALKAPRPWIVRLHPSPPNSRPFGRTRTW